MKHYNSLAFTIIIVYACYLSIVGKITLGEQFISTLLAMIWISLKKQEK